MHQIHKRLVFTVFALFASAAGPAMAQRSAADFHLEVLGHFDADTLAAFSKRLGDYAALRARSEQGLPPLVVTVNADEIEGFERQLAARIRRARSSRRNQVFTPAMERQIKRLLRLKADAGTIESIMDDGPGEPDVDINETYSKEFSLATMPTNILLLLPELPPDMEYRFIGRHLVLRDVRANMIVDEIPRALHCHGCVVEPVDEVDEKPQQQKE
jgi:hypothetical protein